MADWRRSSSRVGGAVALMGVALFIAACGSSGSSSSSPAASTPYSSSKPVSASTGGLTIGMAKGPMGSYLTGASGRALYLWAADTNGKSSCSGACAQTWQPVVASATPSASGGVNAADLAVISRPGGGEQVTYKGHPLYYYAADSGPGMTTGQGTNSFGAKWWLIAPSGTAITATGSTAAASSGGSSGSSSGSPSSGSWGGSSSGSAWG